MGNQIKDLFDFSDPNYRHKLTLFIFPFLLIAVFLLYVSVRSYKFHQSVREEYTAKTRGVVKDVYFRRYGTKSSRETIKVIFFPSSKKDYEVTTEEIFDQEFKVGDSIIVRYQPNNPNNAIVDIPSEYKTNLQIFIGPAIAWLITILLVIYRIKINWVIKKFGEKNELV